MSNFIFVSYNGPDAGIVLAKLLAGEEDSDHVEEVVAETQRRTVGFQIEEMEPEPEDEEVEDD